MDRLRIFMTGVGGQGTLTATNVLAQCALEQGLDVVAGEVHGMAQRGGVVESTVLLGGWRSPRIGLGEADVLLGFEPLETLRATPYLKPGGLVFSSSEFIPPVSVALGKATLPDLAEIRAAVAACASRIWFLPCRSLGLEAGSVMSGNLALLGAVCAARVAPFGPEALKETVRRRMKPKLIDCNCKAVDLGVAAVAA